ncbi:MAG: RNA polymerase sigma factor (sigma-70 family) [Myxococcota bacterium]|jgi:RNA polymerase sigma factor (sigma-70 family)
MGGTVAVAHAQHEEPTDGELMEALRRGERPAAHALYVRHRRAAFDLAARRLGIAEEAEAVVHDAFLKTFAAVCDVRSDRVRSFRAFVLTVTRNLATDKLRRRKRTVAGDVPEGISPAPDLILIEVSRLRTAMDRLPPVLRDIVDLRYQEGLSFRQIAAKLGISRNGAFSRHGRAIQALRDAFDEPRGERP